jgi:5'-nucleotidase
MQRKLFTRMGGVLAAALAVPLLVPVAAGAQADEVPEPTVPEVGTLPEPVAVTRAGGATRIETAIAVSGRFDAADTVVLARQDEYADALNGAPLAASVDGPLLLTYTDDLPDEVADRIADLGATDVVVLGGEAAVSADVVDALESQDLTVQRLAGPTRFETAVAITNRLIADGTSSGESVFLVEGANPDRDRGWPDGVSVSAYAAFAGVPILPVVRDEVPAPVQAKLDELSPTQVALVGGTAAISQEVEDGIDAPIVRRLAGSGRYETSMAVYDEAVTVGMDPATKYLATGAKFADALTGGATAGAMGNPLLLVPGEDITAFPPALARVRASWDLLEQVVLLGGTAAISQVTADAVEALVTPPEYAAADFCLTVLHNNDGESQLINAGSGLDAFGGAARFATRMLTEQARGMLDRDDCESTGILTVSSGDNFLAGPEFNASQENYDDGDPYYDSQLLDYLNYDAVDLGNHDFDFGPEVTANLIEGAVRDGDDITFLSANLQFAGSPLQPWVDSDDLLPSIALDYGDHTVGVIGITPPYLRQISSPGEDIVINGADANGDTDLDAVAQIINAEADDLTDDGADVVVVISHLQDADQDVALVPMLDAVDIVVAGGGDEVLATPGELLVPGDEEVVAGPYPIYPDGTNVPVVTTSGNYKYVGRLLARFDESGDLMAVDDRLSRMVRVAAVPLPDGVEPDQWAQTNIVDPILEYVADLDDTFVATTEVPLDGQRASVRTKETNVGDLLGDAMATTAQDEAADFGLDPSATFVAVTNGGGIRNDSVIPPGNVTLLDTFDIAPFSNFVSVFEDVTVAQLDGLLEHAYEFPFDQAGQFAQLGNLLVDVDREAAVGERVSNIRTADGDPLADGFSLATVNFLADGGDDYPFDDVGLTDYTSVGVTYQQALADWMESLGTITDAGYPDVGGYIAVNDPGDGQRINFTDLD